MPLGPKPTPPIVQFWGHVAIDPAPGACWEWDGARFPTGYGMFAPAHGWTVPAHRWLLEHLTAPLGELCALHKCDNRACVRPSHLWVGTKRDNAHDMIAKGRHFSPFRKT